MKEAKITGTIKNYTLKNKNITIKIENSFKKCA